MEDNNKENGGQQIDNNEAPTKLFAVFVPGPGQSTSSTSGDTNSSPNSPLCSLSSTSSECSSLAACVTPTKGADLNESFVFDNMKDALSHTKQYKTKGARFLVCSNSQDAASFIETGQTPKTCPPINSLRLPKLRPHESPRSAVSKSRSRDTPESQGGEPDCGFKGPTRQEMSKLKKAIEGHDWDTYIELVEQNPRYLINITADVPAIVFEGCRYNAVHLAIRAKDQPNMQVLHDIIYRFTDQSAAYTTQLFPTSDSTSSSVQQEIRERALVVCSRVLDAFMRTPDKSQLHSPLHMAAKRAHLGALMLLLANGAQPDIHTKDKYGNLPVDLVKRDDLVCADWSEHGNRFNNAAEAKTCLVALLSAELCSQGYYLGLYRTDQTLTYNVRDVLVPEPFSGVPPEKYSASGSQAVYRLHACLGPFWQRTQAIECRNKWTSNKFAAAQKRTDSQKGFETAGRLLATEFNVRLVDSKSWSELWLLLSERLMDVCSDKALLLIEQTLNPESDDPVQDTDPKAIQQASPLPQPQPVLQLPPSTLTRPSDSELRPRRLSFSEKPCSCADDQSEQCNTNTVVCSQSAQSSTSTSSHDVSDLCHRLDGLCLVTPDKSKGEGDDEGDQMHSTNQSPTSIDSFQTALSSPHIQTNYITGQYPSWEDQALASALEPVYNQLVQGTHPLSERLCRVQQWLRLLATHPVQDRLHWAPTHSPRHPNNIHRLPTRSSSVMW